MQPPLKIEFLPQYSGSIKVFNKCPSHCTHEIPFATPVFVTSDLVDFLSQSVNGEEYWMELLTISMKQDGCVSLSTDNPFIYIAIMLNGAIPNQLLGNNMLNLLRGCYNIFYIPAGLHPISLPKEDYTVLFFVPASYHLRKMAEEHPRLKYFVNQLQDQSNNGAMLENYRYPYRIWRIIKNMEKCKDKGAALDFTLRRYMLEILGLYHQQLKTPQSNLTTESSKEKACKARDYILANIENPELGGLHELSELFYITPKTLTREFQILFEKTVPEYIRDERMERAHYLLSYTNHSIQEVAEKIGYPYHSHFSRDFKNKYGYSPVSLKQKRDEDE